MATYLQGVQSYIPAVQHFQPDLNILANVLEKKQSQYDSNFKAINDMYGKYFYADLTREDNLKRKDSMLKQIDLDLKRIAGLDLSLTQNANQALQVFKPFYEDGYLMKDMAATKNYKNRRSTAEALKNSSDKDKKSEYWLTGIKKMDYQMEEFKNMPLEQTLSFQDPTYTPYKNPTEYFSKLAKDADLSIDITQPSPDGMYFVRKKNGELLIDPLSTLFSSAVANDPALQEIYSTRAYVERKDKTYANKDKYGGLEQAERAYLMEEYRQLQEFNKKFSQESQQNLASKKIIKDEVDKSYEDGTYSDRTDAASQNLNESIERNQAIANQAQNLNKEMSNGQSRSGVTSNGYEEDLNNIDLLRSKVDYAKSLKFMSDDINASVSALMNKDRIEDIEVNPVGLENLRHGNRLSEMKTKFGYDIQKMQYKAELDMHNFGIKENVKNGVLQVNPDNTIDYTEAYKETLVRKAAGEGYYEQKEKGDILGANKSYLDHQALENAPVVNQMLEFFKAQIDKQRGQAGSSDDKDVYGVFFGEYGNKRGINGLIEDMKKDPAGTMRKIDLHQAIGSFEQNTSSGVYKGVNAAENIIRSSGFNQLKSYSDFLQDMNKVDIENTIIAQQGIARGIDISESAYVDEPWYRLNANDIDAGAQFSSEEFNALNNKLSKLMMNNTTSGPVSREQFKANIRADKSLLGSSRETASQMLQDLDASRNRNASKNTAGGIGSWFYTSPKQADMADVLYDRYKANWDTNKGRMIFKQIHPGSMIPGADGMIYSLQAGTQTGKMVLPAAFGTPNRNLWTETMRDIRGINFNDVNNKISFSGLGKGAKNETAKGLQILEAINSQVSKGEGPRFSVYQSQMAADDSKKGAMIIMPTVKQLQDLGLVGGTEDDPKTLTQAQAAAIAQNGISVISDKGAFKNWLFKDAFITPAEARMNLAGQKGIRYDDPFGNGYYNVHANTGADGSINSYNVTGMFKQRNSQTGELENEEIFMPSIALGGELDNALTGLNKGLMDVGKQNDKIYRQFNPKK